MASRSAPSRDLVLPPVLRTFLLWFLVLSAVSAIAGDIYYRTNRYGQCCTLVDDDPLFCDLWCYDYNFKLLHSSAFFHTANRFAYPAFSAVFYDFVYHLGRHAQAIFLSAELTCCSLAAFLFFRKIRSMGVALFPAGILVVSTLVFSYPLFYMFESGSIEIFTCVFTAAGLWAVLKRRDNSAAVLWGAAAAMKIYPLILLGVFLSRARWRSLLVGIAAFFAISILSMWFVGPTVSAAFAGSISGVGGFVSTYAERVKTNELPLDHSLLAPLKIFCFEMAHRTGTLSYLTKPYIAVAGMVALAAFFLRAWRMPITNQLMFLFSAMVLLPPVSYDHTLVHLYAPWAMVVIVALRAGAAGRTPAGLRTAFLCFAVLFTSQRFLYYHWIHPNGTFKVIALVTLITIALRYPIQDDELYGSRLTTRSVHAAV